ncbi:MAG: hypothetical protein HQL68_06540 [Magnetococcales bacterium]|nr:hypothetical protein [Magnetococcales bacterium]
MVELELLYCAICNPEQQHQEDRRKADPSSNVIQLPNNRRLDGSGRRQCFDRRMSINAPLNKTSLRRSVGRRPFDGKSWFAGTVDNAIKEQWMIDDSKNYVICPRCQRKTG